MWQGNGRGTGNHVPAAVRRAVRRRDGDTCQLGYTGCTGKYEELDHIEGVAARGVDRLNTLTVDELQCACRHCHRIKTQWQAKVGRGLGTPEPLRANNIGTVPTMPPMFRYAPPQVVANAESALTSGYTPGGIPLPTPTPATVGIASRITAAKH